MANYIVTGAAGFIGAAVAQKLISEGNRVVSIDNLSTGYFSNIPEGVEFYEGDCGDVTVYNDLPKIRYDAIIHIAGQSSAEISFDDPIYDIRTNAESTLLLLKFGLATNCHRFVYASSMSVYGKKPDHAISEDEVCSPESFYGVAKLASEHYLRIYRQYGMESTSLRLFNVYGPGQNLTNLRQGMISIYLAQMLKGNNILVKGPQGRFRDFIHIQDVAEIFIKSINESRSFGKNINVGTGVRTTVGEVIDMLTKSSNRPVDVEYTGSTPGDVHGIFADIGLMNKSLFDSKLIPLSAGIRSMKDWAMEQ